MPNTFIRLEAPPGNGVGLAVDTTLTGHPKSFVLSGAVPEGGRYIVEGSNDGGTSWDILVDDDGTQTFFTSRSAGVKSADSVVGLVRVRASGLPGVTTPPSITMGAPPALGTNVFGVLDVPTAPGLGALFDLGLDVGPLKTLILRGSVPQGARFTVLASMDGLEFDEVALFTADQQGARSREVMCRYLRVLRSGLGGPAPVIAVGAEGLFSGTAGGGGEPGPTSVELTLSDPGDHVTTETGREELLVQFSAPVAQLPFAPYTVTLSGLSRRLPDTGGVSRFRVRLAGHPGEPDGIEVLVLEDSAPGEKIVGLRSAPFPTPTTNALVVKVTAEADGYAAGPAHLGNITLFFKPAGE